MSKIYRVKEVVCVFVVTVMAVLGLTAVSIERVQATSGALMWVFHNGDDALESERMVSVAANQAVFDGTFASRNDDGIIRVVLDNYDGDGFHMACRGTCSGGYNKVVIELVGDNKINAEGSVGISTSLPVEFEGKGTLTIRALVPIANGSEESCLYTKDESYCSSMAGVLKARVRDDWSEETLSEQMTSEVIIKATTEIDESGKQPEGDDEVSESDTVKDDANDKDEGLIWHIISGVYMVVMTSAVVILVVWMILEKNKNKKVIVLEEDGKNEK